METKVVSVELSERTLAAINQAAKARNTDAKSLICLILTEWEFRHELISSLVTPN